MKPDVTLITPTRDRPEAFALCQQYVYRQTYVGLMEWIVVDDGDQPAEISGDPKWIRHVRRPASDKPHTLVENLLSALDLAWADKVIVFEDDDWYAPTYVQEMVDSLAGADLVGECRACYYNVRERRYSVLTNTKHASLCQTGFRSRFVPEVREACAQALKAGDPFVDLRLWKRAPAPEWRQERFVDRGLSVGIKGMPGRGGLGMGHRAGALANEDADLAQLREWIGDDVSYYRKYYVKGETTYGAQR